MELGRNQKITIMQLTWIFSGGYLLIYEMHDDHSVHGIEIFDRKEQQLDIDVYWIL